MTPEQHRQLRADRFANMMVSLIRDFCQRSIHESLTKVGYENNFEIISVPPECDELDRLKLEEMRLSTSLNQANLQAAAEDMLAALSGLLEAAQHQPVHMDIMNAARAAIAKAKGEVLWTKAST